MTGERWLVLRIWVCLTGSDEGMTGEVMGIGIDRKGKEGEMEMGFGVIELVGMFWFTILDVTFELGIFVFELGVTIGVGITGVAIGVGITGLIVGLIVTLGVRT